MDNIEKTPPPPADESAQSERADQPVSSEKAEINKQGEKPAETPPKQGIDKKKEEPLEDVFAEVEPEGSGTSEKKVPSLPPLPPAVMPAEVKPVEAPEKIKKPRKPRWIWWGGLALILVLILVGFYFFSGGNEKINFSGQLREALSLLKHKPDDYDSLVQAGVSYYGLGKLKEAAESYKKATEADPNRYLAWNNLGNVYRDLKQFTEAENAYKEALDANPQAITTYVNLVGLYYLWPTEEGSKLDEAEEALLQGLAQNPKNERLLQEIIKLYGKMGKNKEADKYRQMLPKEEA